MISEKKWQQRNSTAFWKEEARCAHVLHLYDTDEAFLDLLEDFILTGFSENESVVIIGTVIHLGELQARLTRKGLDVAGLITKGQYIALNAEEILARFMVNSWPDYSLFMKTLDEVFAKSRKNHSSVRVFGEAVAVLLAQGNSSAVLMLEQLWNMYAEKESFTLFCAYPKSGFDSDNSSFLKNICKAHSKAVTGAGSANLSFQHLN